jgi:Zn-dependent oligopeptidase
MSKHYKTNEPLSDELIEKLVRRCADAVVLSAPFWTNPRHFSRYVNVGLFYLRQLFFAWFDYRVHTDKGKLVGRQHLCEKLVRTIRIDKEDVTALWNDLRESVSLVKGGKRSAGQGSFGHIVGGYDAGYYGYVS